MSQGTRSQVRQMEMEQQLSILITMVQTVQEQQAGQQELCWGLKSDLQGLSASKHEQALRLEHLAHHQEARVEELIQRQNAGCAELEQRQMEAQSAVEILQQDITAVKDVLYSRIRATESGLEGLEITQQRLTAELYAAKTAIMVEMITELEARFATKDQLETTLSRTEATHMLRPGAPEFVPSLCPTTGSNEEAGATGEGGGATTPQLQKPPPFDGRSPWNVYKLQFEMLAAVNGLSNATYLAFEVLPLPC